MKNLSKKILLALTAIVLLFPAVVNATGYQYDEVVVVKDIKVVKQIKHPETGEWKDDLYSSDYYFVPQDMNVKGKTSDIEFKIVVSNTGNTDLEDIKYTDVLPKYVEHVSGDLEGTFDLQVEERKEFYVKARVVKSDQVPDETCVYNLAKAEYEEQEDQDTAGFCIVKPVLGEEVPETGPQSTALILGLSTILGLAGLKIVRKSY